MLRLLLLFFLILGGTANNVYAHSPYAIKQGVIEDPSGHPLIVEKLFGDGIVLSDPASLQIRNAQGAIIAYTPSGRNLAVRCPSINSCWVMPYGKRFGFYDIWKLDPESLQYDQVLIRGGNAEISFVENFENYLHNLEKRHISSLHNSSFGFPDPEERRDSLGFIKQEKSYRSLFFIIWDQVYTTVLVFILCMLPFLFNALRRKAAITASIFVRRVGQVVTIMLTGCAVMVLAFVSLIYLIFLPVPNALTYAAIFCGLVSGFFLFRRKTPV